MWIDKSGREQVTDPAASPRPPNPKSSLIASWCQLRFIPPSGPASRCRSAPAGSVDAGSAGDLDLLLGGASRSGRMEACDHKSSRLIT
jgi:hypothetical protein